uniref:Angiopoietin like 8 n=1 Tax=Poecilia formosa TaxID=48698 RepID=A0A096M3R9_POEFO
HQRLSKLEEVNVLMFGVIQLSESLNYVFETTEAKIERISKALKRHEETLQRLRQQTEQAAEVEQQIKEVVQLLQEQMTKQQAQTHITKDWLNSIEKDEEDLKAKVKQLEMYINNTAPHSLKELQVHLKKNKAEVHLQILKGLQTWNKIQKKDIETQDEQLSKLQRLLVLFVQFFLSFE